MAGNGHALRPLEAQQLAAGVYAYRNATHFALYRIRLGRGLVTPQLAQELAYMRSCMELRRPDTVFWLSLRARMENAAHPDRLCALLIALPRHDVNNKGGVLDRFNYALDSAAAAGYTNSAFTFHGD